MFKQSMRVGAAVALVVGAIVVTSVSDGDAAVQGGKCKKVKGTIESTNLPGTTDLNETWTGTLDATTTRHVQLGTDTFTLVGTTFTVNTGKGIVPLDFGGGDLLFLAAWSYYGPTFPTKSVALHNVALGMGTYQGATGQIIVTSEGLSGTPGSTTTGSYLGELCLP
jgi:hypothetical protein